MSPLILRCYHCLLLSLFWCSFSCDHLLSRQIPIPDLGFFFSFVHDTLAVTPTHTHIETTLTRAHHDNVFTSSSRRSSHFGWFTGALITLCLLALVNTMTTWQRLNIWNTVIISPSSKKTQSVILIAGSWLSALTAATPVCHLPGRHGKKATQKKKCNGWESRFWAAAQYLAGSVTVCMFCLIVKELIIQYFSKWWKCCQGKWRRH